MLHLSQDTTKKELKDQRLHLCVYCRHTCSINIDGTNSRLAALFLKPRPNIPISENPQ